MPSVVSTGFRLRFVADFQRGRARLSEVGRSPVEIWTNVAGASKSVSGVLAVGTMTYIVNVPPA